MIEINAGVPSNITRIILDDRKIIGYRPKLNRITGSLSASVLLGQIMYWAEHSGNPFYKFMQPCDHKQYRSGDSWCEELGISRHEYDGAIKRIGKKVNSKSKDYDPAALVWYWTDMSRLTWYMVNWDLLNAKIAELYSVMPESGNTYCGKAALRNAENRQYVKPESGFTYKEQRVPETTQRVSSSAGARLADPEFNGVAGYREDDDDLYRDLIGLGLPAELAEDVLFRNERCLVEQKLKDMVLALQKGKVENMTGYAMKVFKGVLYSDKQRERILKIDQARRMLKYGRETGKRLESASAIMRQDEETTIEMPEVSEAEKAKYLAELKGNKVLWGIYRQRGFESPMVRSHLKLWHADHADGGTQIERI